MFDKLLEITGLAAEYIRQKSLLPFEIEFKTDASNLVTEVDKGAEKLITDYIRKSFPTHSILAEESGLDSNSGDTIWVIDPLDGTTNFAHGLPIYSVSIGIMKNNEIIMGAIADVSRNVIYSAELGGGAHKAGKKIQVSQKSVLAESLLVTGFPYDFREHADSILSVFGSFVKKARGIRRLGSAAIDFCYIAQGAFDGYWEMHLNPWDICAGKLIVQEAGGMVTDYKGNPSDIYKKEILCSNGLLHPEMVKIIAESGLNNA